MSQNGVQVGEGSAGVAAERQLLLEIAAEIDQIDQANHQLANLPLLVLHAGRTVNKKIPNPKLIFQFENLSFPFKA